MARLALVWWCGHGVGELIRNAGWLLEVWLVLRVPRGNMMTKLDEGGCVVAANRLERRGWDGRSANQ